VKNQKGFLIIVVGLLLLGLCCCVAAYSTYELQRAAQEQPHMLPAH
jgi:hypothetical protein